MRAAACTLLLASATAAAGTLGRQAETRPDAPSVAVTTSVRSLYIVHCAGCHGRDAAGSTLGNVPDMRRLGQFLQLEGGREFVIKVPGVMGSGLSDQQVADVTNWMLQTLAPGSAPAGHLPYEAAEVRSARETPLLDVAAARERLLAQARARGLTID
jgi:mono/diheme cytochrome c family protein